MIKTQIQLPDALYRDLKRVAEEREMSLAEVLRRGAEYITRVYQPQRKDPDAWTLPGPFRTNPKDDPFADPAWRYNLHAAPTIEKVVREKAPTYMSRRGKKGRS